MNDKSIGYLRGYEKGYTEAGLNKEALDWDTRASLAFPALGLPYQAGKYGLKAWKSILGGKPEQPVTFKRPVAGQEPDVPGLKEQLASYIPKGELGQAGLAGATGAALGTGVGALAGGGRGAGVGAIMGLPAGVAMYYLHRALSNKQQPKT